MLNMVALFFLLFLSISQLLEANSIYEGHQVLKLKGRNSDEILQFKGILDKQFTNKFQYFKELKRKNDDALYIEAHRSVIPAIRRAAFEGGIASEITIPDLKSDIEAFMAENERHRYDDEWFLSYHDLQEIMDWVDNKAVECGERCEILELDGLSFEGRILKVIKIGTPGEDKPHLWIDATIHAREWIAPAVAMYFIERLVDDYGVDPNVTTLVDTYDIYIEPMVNPDGYEYSWTDDRLWRKSRYVNDSHPCIGTDVNRNFDFQWDTVGTGDSPCDITWPGYFPFSDPEALHLANFVQNTNGGRWKLFFTMHSYSQLWMLPYGYTTDPVVDYDKLLEAGEVAAEALTSLYGTEYDVGAASEILYLSSGTSRDWGRGVLQGEYVYTIELRDTGEHGFELPPEQILPCAEETWAGLKAFLLFITD